MFYHSFKRTIDVVGASSGLVLLSPLLLSVACIIKLESHGPIFYTPQRVGRGGKTFRMYKFRTMKMYKISGKLKHADEILKLKPKLMREYKKSGYKLNKDPRLTRFGAFLRKSSIDELPQLVNILKGEMSIVGPRAYLFWELSDQQRRYPRTKKYVKTLLLAKPGLTGFWQVSGRSLIPFEKRIKMDAKYVRTKSIIYDLSIILKTIPAVLKGRGAV